MRSRILSVFALFVALSASVLAQEWTITPGQGVGPVKLGMKRSEIERASKTFPQGKGVLTSRSSENTYIKGKGWIISSSSYGGVDVQWLPTAIQIIVNRPNVSVDGKPVNLVGPGGLRVGGTLANMQSALGQWDDMRELKPQKNVFMYIYKKGIGCVIKGGRIESISVFAAK